MNIPHDSSCHEGSKNVYFIQVRNLEGQNHPGHAVLSHISSHVFRERGLNWKNQLLMALRIFLDL